MAELLIWLVRIVIVMLVWRAISRMLMGGGGGRRPAPPPRPGPPVERLGGALVRDPQCGTYVPESRAVTIGSGAAALHFCSTTCRDAWNAKRA